MFLWTIQPEEVWIKIQETGFYRCDPYKSDLLQPMQKDLIGKELEPKFEAAYAWLADQMDERIEKRPDGVRFPVWAWYQFNWKHKADLRKERWECGYNGDRFACIELSVPDKKVLLSDFHLWHYVLNRWPISDSEEESIQMDEFLDDADQKSANAFFQENWKRIFEMSPFEKDWMNRVADIQATFWELKKEYVTRVRFFTASRKRKVDD